MAVGYNPRIVTDGLVLALDAGNTKSYPGSGTTWYDLSGKGNNGTFVNMGSSNLDSANGGSLTFDGTDEYITLASQVLFNITGSAFSVWFTVGIDFSSNYGGRGIILGSSVGTKYNRLFAISGRNGLQGETNTNEEYYLTGLTIYNGWNNVQVSFENSVAKTYLNGVLGQTSSTLTNDLTLDQISSSASDANYQGKIAQVSMYNRALTASEIQQNFNALRGRFGI